LQVAALDLAGVGDVVWDVEVVNGATPAEVVWHKRLASSRYGDGAGSASVVGPCDADPDVSDNTVRVWVVGVYAAPVSDPGAFNSGAAAGPGAVVGQALPFEDPTASAPLTREVVCAPNSDARVSFEVALMRPAQQGFFDIAVSFNDIFCSAKFDCCDSPAAATCDLGGSEDIALLFDAGGQRASTMVLGFACTGGLGADVETQLYLDALELDCTDPTTSTFDADLVLNPAGAAGNRCIAAANGMSTCTGVVTEVQPLTVDADTFLFQLAVYRGVEALESGGVSAQKVYWNVALGVKRPAIGQCWLRTRGTADDVLGTPAVDQGTIAAGLVYPYLQWDVPLGACGAEALTFGDPAAKVRPAYTGTGDGPTTFAYAYGPNMPAGAFCATPCVNGGQCVAGACACPEGFSGPTCATAAACGPPSPCDNGGTCAGAVGGYVCTCVGDYSGDQCEIPPLECGTSGAPCPEGEVCTAGDVCVAEETTPNAAPVAISPATASVPLGGGIVFAVTGGDPPYSYILASGGGDLLGASYTAPAEAGSATVRVSDAFGGSADAAVTVYAPLSLAPSAVTVDEAVTFSVSGGVGPYTLTQVGGGGALSGSDFTAPAVPGLVTIRVADAVGNSVDATVSVTAGLALSPSTVAMAVNTTRLFTATGGAGENVFTVVSGAGLFAGATYTAPPGGGAATVRVTDGVGNTADASVTIFPTLVLAPTAPTVQANETVTFTVSGGVPGYTLARTSGNGTLAGQVFTAPASAGTATVRVTDSLGNTRDVVVTITAAGAGACAPNPCQHGGTCTRDPDDALTAWCTCVGGYSGEICATPPPPCGSLAAPCDSGYFCTPVGLCLDEAVTQNATPVAISPSTVEVTVGSARAFTATAGNPPYVFTIVSGDGVMNDAVYTAPAWEGAAVVRVTDAFGVTSDAAVTVVAAVQIDPNRLTLLGGESVTFTASGGSGGYTYTKIGGGGTLVGATFTAPGYAGNSYIRVRDSAGRTDQALVTTAVVKLSPSAPLVLLGGSVSFTGSGGQAPYSYALVSGPGSLNDRVYTGPTTPATAVVRVTEAHGWTAEATITTYAPLTLSPASVTVQGGDVVPYTATGGVGAYTFVKISGGGTLVGGTFTAPPDTDATVIQVRDAHGHTATANVATYGPLSVSPASVIVAPGSVIDFTVHGGVGAYSSSLESGAGTLVGTTFTAPALGGVSVVRFTDEDNTVVEATVTVLGFASISAGGSGSNATAHGTTCAVKSDGTLWCWGYNGDGQLGDGTKSTRYTPARVGLLDTWASVDVGGRHSCGVRQDGTAWCWGYNSNGQLGDGTVVAKTVPVQVGSDTDWVALSAGTSSTCGRRSDQSLWCWGLGTSGQLGDKTATSSSVPVEVAGGAAWASVSVGEVHTCGVQVGGTGWCWGNGGYGRLGYATVLDPDTGLRVPDPREPNEMSPGTTNWVTIGAGDTHTCGVRSDGTLWCWGGNGLGQVGNDTTSTTETTPVQIGEAGVFWTTVGVGSDHTCAIADDGGRYCWGSNSYSAVVGAGVSYVRLPTLAYGGGSWVALTAGTQHSCAVRVDGTVWCWGRDHEGQQGIGERIKWATPVAFAGVYSGVAAGDGHGCGLRADGSVWCWGLSNYGQVGDGGEAGAYGRLPGPLLDTGGPWRELARGLGGDHSCAVRPDGTAWCWGSGGSGQRGDGTTTYRVSAPVAVVGGHLWDHVSLGDNHTCGIRTDHTLWCWGKGSDGRLGYGSTGDKIIPTQVGTDNDWAEVDAGYSHTCAVRTGGTLWCWGYNNNAQLGDGSVATRTTPVEIGAGVAWETVSAAQNHTCGLRVDGTVWCWGYNGLGQVGDGSTIRRATPVQTGIETSWTGVSAGGSMTCGSRSDGSLWCWGSNTYGQLGLGNFTAKTVPTLSTTRSDWATVDCGSHYTCAVTDAGALFCWGYNAYGQTSGLGGLARPYPSQVP
jgi:alpha-tubulin suppressor-like RCC1 family protein